MLHSTPARGATQGSDLNHEVTGGHAATLPAPNCSHDSHAHCTTMCDMHYRGVLVLQAAPWYLACMSCILATPQHSPTLAQRLQGKHWQAGGVLGGRNVLVFATAHSWGLCSRRRVSQVQRSGRRLCGMQRLVAAGPPQTFYSSSPPWGAQIGLATHTHSPATCILKTQAQTYRAPSLNTQARA